MNARNLFFLAVCLLAAGVLLPADRDPAGVSPATPVDTTDATPGSRLRVLAAGYAPRAELADFFFTLAGKLRDDDRLASGGMFRAVYRDAMARRFGGKVPPRPGLKDAIEGVLFPAVGPDPGPFSAARRTATVKALEEIASALAGKQ